MTPQPLERRGAPRIAPDDSPWKPEALLRPGVPVKLLNIGTSGALVESPARMRPGRRAELQLTSPDSDCRRLVVGRVARCHVAGLAPLCFHGAIAFDGQCSEGG